MRRIRQRDSTGCGLACIAMVAGINYEDVRAIAVSKLGWDETGDFYTGTRDLRDLAGYFGIAVGKRRRSFKSFNALPDTAILANNYKEQTDTWHWVVFHRIEGKPVIYDPNQSIKNDKRRDFGRIKAKWFLPVLNYRDSYSITKKKEG